METQLLIGAVVLLAAVVLARFGARLGLPSLLIFLALGLLLGDAGLGIRFSDASLAHNLGFAGLVLILAEGGLTTKWSDIRPAIAPAAVLATLGIAVSIGTVAAFAHVVLGLDWSIAVLLGAVISPTDSAAIFSVLRNLPLPGRISATLEGESGLNDAPTVIIVTVATAISLGHPPSGGFVGLGLLIGYEFLGGLAMGIAVGVIAVLVMKALALPSSGLAALAMVGWAVLAYGIGAWLHMSGFAAVYAASVMLGNASLPYRRTTRSFVEGIGWIAQIGLFIMLGLLASPRRLTLPTVLLGIAIGAFLTFVARPLSVLLSLTPFRYSWREQAFVSWAGLRGAVPIILATVPLAASLPRAERLFDLVFVFVVVYTILQGPTLAFVAKRLRVAVPMPASDLEVEAAPLDRIAAELMYIKVPEGSRLGGVSLRELRLPRGTVVSLVMRADHSFAPQPQDVIRAADELLIVVPATARATVERRLREIDTGGRLARWRRPSAT